MWKKCCLFLITDVLWIHVHVYAGEEGRVYVADDEGRRGGRKGEGGEEGEKGRAYVAEEGGAGE